MTTAVISGRVNETVRQKADIAIRKAGISPSEIIQNIWSFIAESGEIPPEAMPSDRRGHTGAALDRYDQFLATLPERNPTYEGWTDEDILALKVRDHA